MSKKAQLWPKEEAPPKGKGTRTNELKLPKIK